MADDLIEYCPFDRLGSTPPVSRDWHYVSAEEFAKLMGAATSLAWRLLLGLGRWAALRRGEALNLRWRNIDWANNRLRVISQDDWDVKDKDARVVPICPELHELLLAAFDEAEEGEERVIPVGTISVKNISRNFGFLCKRAGVERYAKPLHTLRKSCITDWASRFPAHVVKQWAGHSDLETTDRYYLQVSEAEYERAAATRMSQERTQLPTQLAENEANSSEQEDTENSQPSPSQELPEAAQDGIPGDDVKLTQLDIDTIRAPDRLTDWEERKLSLAHSPHYKAMTLRQGRALRACGRYALGFQKVQPLVTPPARPRLWAWRYHRYRLQVVEAEETMARSLRRYGQISPIVVCLRDQTPELIDGFKRLAAARSISGIETLSARRLDGDERTAKAAIHGLNCVGRRLQELEEAWIVHALVREDGLSQVEAAELLGRHKSWVNRRLAMLEKLGVEAREDLRLGLLSPTAARQLTRLPAGNQPEVLAAIRRESLTAEELGGVVDLLLASASRQKEEYVLAKPREALRQVRGVVPPSWDPRLSSAGNRISKQLGLLLDQLSRMETWLRHRGRGELSVCDRGPLAPGFSRLSRDTRSVAELADDFLVELKVR